MLEIIRLKEELSRACLDIEVKTVTTEGYDQLLKDSKEKKEKVKERKFGCAKGLIIMHDDFDAPLEDFKEYM